MDSLSTSPPNFALTPPQVLKPKHLWMAHPKYGVAPPLDLLESQTPCSDHITRPEVHRSSTTATPSSSRRIEDSGGVRATREQSYRIHRPAAPIQAPPFSLRLAPDLVYLLDPIHEDDMNPRSAMKAPLDSAQTFHFSLVACSLRLWAKIVHLRSLGACSAGAWPLVHMNE